ncbi:MAG: hypothetical protein Q7T83_06645 [Thermodesulfovibrionales bacterium]|nr:hypothetical protein [Thermodesulfovibrionales bacterium]MDP3112354.1 hypothetical protein [Thermodesulfovibrionales bacterium]
MTIETGLLMLESILLVVTIILLIYSIKEGRGRKGLLLEVGKATKILTRQEYFLTVTDSMMDAKTEVIGAITGRLPAGDDKKRTQDVTTNIERLAKNNVSVKYLLPKFPDRLHIGYLYTKAGAEVRYSGCAVVHDIRYIVVDEKLVVIGIPESIGEKEATKKGYRIPSEGLAAILKEHFNGCWDKNIRYEDYVKEVIKQTGTTTRSLARELQIDEEELEKLTKTAA